MGKKIFLTGGTGYIGKSLLKKLLAEGFSLIVLVRDRRDLQSFSGFKNLEILKGDLSDTNILHKGVGNAEWIIHLAAIMRMYDKDNLLKDVNIEGLKNLLECCHGKRIKFIFSSSIEAEKLTTPYGYSKLAGEKIIKDFAKRNHDFSYVILRLGNVEGGGGGFSPSIKEYLIRNNWRTSILCHTLKDYPLHLVALEQIKAVIFNLLGKDKLPNKTYTLVSQTITVDQIVKHFKKNEGIDVILGKLLFGNLILTIWNLLAKIIRSGDILTYLSLGGEKEKKRIFDINSSMAELNFKPKKII